MKYISLFLVLSGLIVTDAFAINLEDPLYTPTDGEFYTKTGGAIMYKRADHSKALQDKGIAGNIEFPIWRFTEDVGFGITDRLSLRGQFGWTQDMYIDRKGAHRGRLGALYRILTSQQSVLTWDVYADAFLSGLTPMKGSYGPKGFTYDNYSNGRWGVYGGTRIGKQWEKWTVSGYFEYLQTFGNHNNRIKIDQNMKPEGSPFTMAEVGIPSEISVNLKGTHEINFGVNGFYQFAQRWSVGGSLEFAQHTDNAVTGIDTPMIKVSGANAVVQQKVVDELLKKTADMDEGWNEYIMKLMFSWQMSENTQLSLFGEYTFDTSHPQSQNGTDVKTEVGLRFSGRF